MNFINYFYYIIYLIYHLIKQNIKINLKIRVISLSVFFLIYELSIVEILLYKLYFYSNLKGVYKSKLNLFSAFN